MIRMQAALLVALGFFAFATPLTARADDKVVQYEIQTRLASVAQPGELDGTLKITVSSSGIISGQFYLASETGVHDVIGGLKGDRIWLHIGSLNTADDLQMTGTFKNGVLDMTTALNENGDTAAERGQVRTFTSVKTTQITQ